MSPNEEMTQASRPKRPAAATAVSSAAAAAGTRLRRPAPSKVRAEKSRPKKPSVYGTCNAVVSVGTGRP